MTRTWRSAAAPALLFSTSTVLLLLWYAWASNRAWLAVAHYIAQLGFFLALCIATRGLTTWLYGLGGVLLIALAHAITKIYFDFQGIQTDWRGSDGVLAVLGIQAVFSTYLLLIAFGVVYVTGIIRSRWARGRHADR